jgi:hypothetical protein
MFSFNCPKKAFPIRSNNISLIKYLQSGSISRNGNILEGNRNNLQLDRNSQRRPIEDELSISNNPSNGIDGFCSVDISSQPVSVVDDGKWVAIWKKNNGPVTNVQ